MSTTTTPTAQFFDFVIAVFDRFGSVLSFLKSTIARFVSSSYDLLLNIWTKLEHASTKMLNAIISTITSVGTILRDLFFAPVRGMSTAASMIVLFVREIWHFFTVVFGDLFRVTAIIVVVTGIFQLAKYVERSRNVKKSSYSDRPAHGYSEAAGREFRYVERTHQIKESRHGGDRKEDWSGARCCGPY